MHILKILIFPLSKVQRENTLEVLLNSFKLWRSETLVILNYINHWQMGEMELGRKAGSHQKDTLSDNLMLIYYLDDLCCQFDGKRTGTYI